MSYRNPAIIKDTSGQMVPNAIAQSMQTVAQGYKEGILRQDRISVANAKSNSRRAAENTKANDKAEADALEINKGTGGLSDPLGRSTQDAKRKIIDWDNSQIKITEDKNSTDEEKAEARQNHAIAMVQLDDINTFIETKTLRKALALENVKVFDNTSINYVRRPDPKSADGTDGGRFAQRAEWADGGINGYGITVQYENNKLSIVGTGAAGGDWEGFNMGIKAYNSSDNQTTFNVTDSTGQAQKMINDAILNTEDPTLLKPKFKDGESYNKVIIEKGADGTSRVYNAVVQNLNKDSMQAEYDSALKLTAMGIQGLPKQDRDANMRIMNIDVAEYYKKMTDTENPTASQAEAYNMILDNLKKNKLYKGSTEGIRHNEETGSWTRTIGTPKEVVWKNKNQMAKLDINEGFENMKERSGYDANVPGSMNLNQLFSEALNGDISVDGSKKTISGVNIKNGVLYLHRNSGGLETDAANYRKPMEYVINDPGQITSALKNIYQNRGMKSTNAYEAGAQLEELYFNQLQN